MTTPQHWGSDILVNGLGDASEPQITALADGRFVVAWIDNNKQEIRAQVLNADGSLRGGPFTINATSAGEQQLPNITALPDGRFVAVWTDQRDWQDNGENADIYGQIFSIDGNRIGGEFKINDGVSVPSAHALIQPDITTLSDGGFAVTWRDYIPSEGGDSVQVWTARYGSDGQRIGTITLVDLTQDVAHARPVIEALDDNKAIMVWTEGTVTNAINLHGRVINADGSTAFELGNIGLVRDDADNVVQIAPNITRLKNGNFVVTWKVNDGAGGGEDYAVWARVFNPAGAPQTAAFKVVEATDEATDSADIDPVVTALNDGRFMVTWADYHAYGSLSTEVKSQVYTSGGIKDGDTFTVHTPRDANDRMPSVATLVDGRVVVSWWHDGQPTIRAHILDPRKAGIKLAGTALNDDYVGTGFDDELSGGQGDDRFDGSAGADIINGGDGFDTVTFAKAASGVVASLTGGSAGDAAGDVYTSIERLIGSNHADSLTGNGAAVLQGGRGNDTYYVSGSDRVIETAGGGFDTVVFRGSYQLNADADVEVLKLAGVSASASVTLIGSNSANTLQGHAGKNILKGLGGNDVLKGGYGNDTLYGGSGKDTFIFDTKLGSSKTDRKVNFDKIADFNVKDDSIWLDNAIFKKLGKGTALKPGKLNKAFFTIGDKAKDKNDYLVYNKKTGVLSYDVDGSGAKGAIEIAVLRKGLKLTYNDFFVV